MLVAGTAFSEHTVMTGMNACYKQHPGDPRLIKVGACGGVSTDVEMVHHWLFPAAS